MPAMAQNWSVYNTRSEWDSKPIVHPVPPEYNNEPAFFVLNDLSMDYRHEGRNSTNVYYTMHRIVKVLDNRGIESFNTVSIPVNFGTRVPSIKARTILPNGQVREIPQSMIKVTKDPTGRYKIVFAMEGVEKNAEIEMIVKTIRPASYFNELTFQYSIPVLHSTFSMSYPKDLTFRERGFNGYPTVKEEESKTRKSMKIAVHDIPAAHEEPHSFYSQNVMRAVISIKDFAADFDKTQELNFDSLARYIYTTNYKYTTREKGAVNKFLMELGVDVRNKERDNIIRIENGIKTRITQYALVDYEDRDQVIPSRGQFRSLSLYDVDHDADRDVLDSVLSKHAATPEGMVRLFAACFTQAGIAHELGLTANRQEYVVNSNMPNLNEMDTWLFYFPKEKKFLAPVNTFYRYPMVPAEVTGNKGVFCTMPAGKSRTEMLQPIYEMRKVAPFSYKESVASVNANVSFNKEMDALLDISYAYTGYEAADLRTTLAVIPRDKIKDLVKQQVTVADKHADILNYTISGEGFQAYNTNKPLEIYASVQNSSLMAKAGKDKYLFSVGHIIGQQDELYNEDERHMPVDLVYPHSYSRTITVNIPKGYKVTNLGSLKLDADHIDDDGNVVMAFKSDYRADGNKLIITVSEFYNQLHFEVTDYERYRKVVNTAADFSKVVLLLEKGQMPKPKKKVNA